jgi:hypothetical protein
MPLIGKKFITLSKGDNMTSHYFVEVIADNGEINRWEALTKEQADFIYKQQVEVNGSENCKTGKTAGINCNPAHRW